MLATIVNDANVRITITAGTGTTPIIDNPTTNLIQCSGSPNNPVVLEVRSSTIDSRYYYDWQPVNAQNITSISFLSPLVTTTYTVTASDRCMNPKSAQETVHIDNDINFSINGAAVVCENSTNHPYNLVDYGNTNYTYTFVSTNNSYVDNGNKTATLLNAGLARNSPITVSYTATPTTPSSCTHTVTKIIPVV